MKRREFETSRELKLLFGELFDQWRRKNPDGLEGLARRCGVSQAYLAHVRRYGRVPGRPVLILLALNFGVDGSTLFRAAAVKDAFPYESDQGIARIEKPHSGLLSLHLDMDGFTAAIRDVVRAELKQRSSRDVLARRPLRIGLNWHQFWVYDSVEPPLGRNYTGLFPDFCRMLGVALQREVELEHVPYSEYMTRLEHGEIDFYGPMFIAPHLPGHILFSAPLFKLGVGAIARRRSTSNLEDLPIPESINDLRNKPYQIAVLRNAFTHLFAKTSLKRSDENLILVESDEEGVDRVLLRGIKRPAHIFIVNAASALLLSKRNPRDLQPVFADENTMLDMCDSSVAIRPDWPEIQPIVSDAVKFLLNRGGFAERIAAGIPQEIRKLVDIQH